MKTRLKHILAAGSLILATSITYADVDVVTGASVGSDAKYDYLTYEDGLNIAPEEFGLVDEVVVALHQQAFQGRDAAAAALKEQSSAWRHCSGSCWLDSTIYLPSGAKITGIEIDLDDSNAAGSVNGYMYHCSVGATTCPYVATLSTGDAATPGITQAYAAADHTVLNGAQSYSVAVRLTGGTTSTRFGSYRVFYKRQISPAPGVATFMDVPISHPFFGNVEALAASGITGGCGGGNYCPDNFVTRAQMAAFLSRALGLHWDGF